MKFGCRILIGLVAICLSDTLTAQSTVGVTNVPDTSYSTNSAYISTLKTYPGIKIVPELKDPSIVEKKGLIYCKTGQRSLVVDAFYPKTKRNGRTAIIMIHGGGWRSGNRAQHYPLAQHLVKYGYVCFTPEYRLSTEALYPAAVNDLKAMVRWIHAHAKEYGIDPRKIVVAGFSAGGELASFLGTTIGDTAFNANGCNPRADENIAAVVDIDGTLSFVHPESGEGDDSKKISAGTYWFGYGRKDNPALWESASPLAHVGKTTPPFLFINSGVDRMHAGRDDFRAALDSMKIYSEVQTFERSPHSFCLFEPWFFDTVRYIDNFLTKVVK
jgi:acetyl esterase/lipase